MQRSTLRHAYELISSMRFAISLLTILAIASIIGTVLKQNEPWNNYLNQFGPFWFPIFAKLGLYSVYNSNWFLVILAFLVISTTACIIRQTPIMLREMRSFREHAKEDSLASFGHHSRFSHQQTTATAKERLQNYLTEHGFKVRADERSDGVLLAGKQGSWGRVGYFLAHGAIIFICLGGLMDGNLPLKMQMWFSGKEVTSGNQLISEIPEKSRLGVNNWSYRANVFIPEGKSSDIGVLNVQDGILLQDLPFSVSLKKFHLEHYSTGMPKRFASDIILTDKQTGESLEKTIEVNKPFEYKGITLYQASFEDGGSRLSMLAYNLTPGDHSTPLALSGEVGNTVKLSHPKFSYTMELNTFKAINVESFADRSNPQDALASVQKHLGSGAKNPEDKDLRNVGPSLQFKLRDSAGQAREYLNYMYPIEQEGRRYLISGMRESGSEGFRFMRMPVDENSRIDTWFAIRRLLLDPSQHQTLAKNFTRTALKGEKVAPTVELRMEETAYRTLQLFATGGFESLGRFIEKTVPKAEQEKAADVFVKVLQGVTWEAWMTARKQAGLGVLDLNEARTLYVRDTLNSISDSFHYGAPLWFELKDFTEVRATVLQATRSPGKPWVYLGSLLLALGVCAMLYIRERRLFVLLKNNGDTLVALSSNRKSLDVEESFIEHQQNIQTLLGSASPQHHS